MLICFECDRETKDLLDRIKSETEARDYGELIHAALSAYQLLLKQATPTGSVVVGEDREVATSPATKPYRGERSKAKPATALEVPIAFARPLERLEGVPIERKPRPGAIAAEDWLFGQLNRLLPVKASCRALANLSLANGGGVPLRAAVDIAKDAAVLGEILRSYDAKLKLGRDDRFATAFPFSGSDGEKGRLRYSTQFVAYADREGNLTGLPAGLRLLDRVDDDSATPMIALTSAGWDFALLPNPALDDLSSYPTQRLSADEREMLLQHVCQSVPSELDAYCTLLTAIGAGKDTPTGLDEITAAHSTAQARERVSGSFISTQRSGAISRMTDLFLVTRQRAGSRVIYQVTDNGHHFLEHVCTKPEDGEHE